MFDCPQVILVTGSGPTERPTCFRYGTSENNLVRRSSLGVAVNEIHPRPVKKGRIINPTIYLHSGIWQLLDALIFEICILFHICQKPALGTSLCFTPGTSYFPPNSRIVFGPGQRIKLFPHRINGFFQGPEPAILLGHGFHFPLYRLVVCVLPLELLREAPISSVRMFE